MHQGFFNAEIENFQFWFRVPGGTAEVGEGFALWGFFRVDRLVGCRFGCILVAIVGLIRRFRLAGPCMVRRLGSGGSGVRVR